MPKKSIVILPETRRYLEEMGKQIKLARLRRKLSASLVAEYAGISRATLCETEASLSFENDQDGLNEKWLKIKNCTGIFTGGQVECAQKMPRCNRHQGIFA